MATAPRPGGTRREEAAKASVTITVDGVAHTFRPVEVSANMIGQLRRATGMSLAECMEAAQKSPDLDVLAAMVWLARRQAGEAITYDEVADALTYDTELEVDDAEPEEDPSLPEP